MDCGVWAPVVGYWIQQIMISIGTLWASRYMPRLTKNLNDLKDMVQYGIGYSSSMWVWQIRSLINPLIVGKFLGAEAVGIVALAIRVVEALSFVKKITWRISISALAKVQGDNKKLKDAVDEGMMVQVIAVGPFLVGFSLLSPYIIPIVFGQKWMSLSIIFPFIALSYLINSVFNMHSSVLYVKKENWSVTLFHMVHVIIFFISSIIFVPLLGVAGYGWAEVAAFLGYIVIHYKLSKHMKASYKKAVPWIIGFIPLLFVNFANNIFVILLMFLPLLMVIINKNSRYAVLKYKNYIIRRSV